MYPIEKYKFFTTKAADGCDKVIAISTYAGRTVRGVAICSADDTFSLEKGKELAALRCAKKIAHKRIARAKRKYREAEIALEIAEAREEQMEDYVDDAYDALDDIEEAIAKLLEDM